MKISILIIAHNEEAHIEKCLSAIIEQTQKPHEIVLIAHNCTDRTVEIAKNYQEVMLHELKTPET
jgi:poly-beta-1,6-N-acetyl-D-glucosamine synthase